MATWTGQEHAPNVIAAAARWRESCLLNDGSVFSDQDLWNETNFDELKSLFINNPILGDQPFYEKLKLQIGDARPAICHLAAEAFWLLLLFVYERQYGVQTKRNRIAEVWKYSGQDMPEFDVFDDDAYRGLANPGASFLTRIWVEFGFLLTVLHAFKSLDLKRQRELLEDNPWELCNWVTAFEGGDVRAFRHMFLYFCYPEYFERSCSRNHKQKIYESFVSKIEEEADPYARNRTPCTLDTAIFLIRQKLETEHETTEVDFYRDQFRSLWLDTPSENEDEDGEEAPAASRSEESASVVWIEKTIVHGRPDREEGPHRLGAALWSPQRSTNGRDIYANMREISAGDIVLHLTDNEAVSGVSIAESEVDEEFTGVHDSNWGEQPSYRVSLRDYVRLEPVLARNHFFGDDTVAEKLLTILHQEDGHGLFYNSNLELNQGAYLTASPPELSALLSETYRKLSGQGIPYLDKFKEGPGPEIEVPVEPPRYMIADAQEELFLEQAEFEKIMSVWRAKKNLIVQGPPGVGKTFAARRLAYVLMGFEAPQRVGFVQFHQSYSYEDFVQGYRPQNDGFELRNGRFFEFCRQAADEPDNQYVFIIDEINRGNLSKIFGELMLLIESDKRSADWATPLAYDESGQKFHVPENVYLLGLMNTADRSLAVVDYALRRRFAFFDLQPKFETLKFGEQLERLGLSPTIIELIRQRIGELNSEIENDQTNLGRGFCIGHSYFCQKQNSEIAGKVWYREIIETEIVPLLEEYWFDSPSHVADWTQRLLAGI